MTGMLSVLNVTRY